MIKPGDIITVNGTVIDEHEGYIQIRMKSGAECWIKSDDIATHWVSPSSTEYFVERVRAIHGS